MTFDGMNRGSHRAKTVQINGKMFRPNDLGWCCFEYCHRNRIGSEVSLVQINPRPKSHRLQFGRQRSFPKHLEQTTGAIRENQGHPAIFQELVDVLHDRTGNIAERYRWHTSTAIDRLDSSARRSASRTL